MENEETTSYEVSKRRLLSFRDKFFLCVVAAVSALHGTESITLSPYNGSTTFHESSVGSRLGRINVSLSMMPSTNITVHLDVRRDGPDDGNYPLPVLNSYDVEFGGTSGNTTSAYVYLESLDGTWMSEFDGFIISAAVTNTTLNVDGVAWTNLYSGASLPVTIYNEDPQILTETSDQIIQTSGIPFSFNYTVRDVPSDFAKGLTVAWTTSEGVATNYTITANGSGQYVDFEGESPMFFFTAPGHHTVTLSVEDKDYGDGWRSWYFNVLPAKSVYIYPRRPSSGYMSEFSRLYAWASGIGEGRVWADGAAGDFYNFCHNYAYDPRVSYANVYARGYKVGDVDNGTLLPGTDIAIDVNGNHYRSGQYSSYYTSSEQSGRDSFFYSWILCVWDENSGRSMGVHLGPHPTAEAKGTCTANGHQRVELPEYDEGVVSYAETLLEAIFSKEFLTSDDLGDINQDGIPDIYAVEKMWRGESLLEIVGGSAENGDDVSFRLNAYNGDGDYLPTNPVTAGLMTVASNTATQGVPFSAMLEIRGFHQGLNHRAEHDGMNRFVRGAWISEPCFSEAESNAIARVNNLWAEVTTNGNGEIAYRLPDPANAAEMAAWSNGIFSVDCWIPENRTDPTVFDTDGDRLPDGYEYWFWYAAMVGEDGKERRLRGAMLSRDGSGTVVEISPEEIAAAFNPTVESGIRDTDNDGLADYEEYVLGTNPIDWDSDNDGISDSREANIGSNPFLPDTGLVLWLEERGLTADNRAANGRTAAECYGLGLDPAESTNDFRIVSIELVDGKPKVEWEPKTNRWTGTELNALLQGAIELDGPWSEVPPEGNPAYRFFKVVVELP